MSTVHYVQVHERGPGEDIPRCCLGLIAFFIPPVAVFLVRGCSEQFWLNLVLFLLFWIFAMIHAMVLVCQTPDPPIQAPSMYPNWYGPPQGETFLGHPVEPAVKT